MFQFFDRNIKQNEPERHENEYVNQYKNYYSCQNEPNDCLAQYEPFMPPYVPNAEHEDEINPAYSNQSVEEYPDYHDRGFNPGEHYSPDIQSCSVEEHRPGMQPPEYYAEQHRPGMQPPEYYAEQHRPGIQPPEYYAEQHRPGMQPPEYYAEQHRPGMQPPEYYAEQHRPGMRPLPERPGEQHRPGMRPLPERPGEQHKPGRNDRVRPHGRPPRHIPRREEPGVRAVDPWALRRCEGEYVYIWLRNGQSFWMYLTYVGRKSISGYRWTNFGWIYAGFDLSYIDGFYCL